MLVKTRKFLFRAVLLFSLFLLVQNVFVGQVLASSTTKTWTNGNGTDQWNDADNWDPSGVPGSGDDVVFNATYTDSCTIDVDSTITSLTIQSGYTGPVSLGSYTLTITGDFTIEQSNAFDSGTGTVKFTGSDKTVDIDNPTTNSLYDMQVTLGSYKDITIDGTIYVDHDLKILGSSGLSTLQDGTINVGNDVVTNSQIGGDATILLNGAHTINAGGQSGRLPNLEITGGSVDASGAVTLG